MIAKLEENKVINNKTRTKHRKLKLQEPESKKSNNNPDNFITKMFLTILLRKLIPARVFVSAYKKAIGIENLKCTQLTQRRKKRVSKYNSKKKLYFNLQLIYIFACEVELFQMYIIFYQLLICI